MNKYKLKNKPNSLINIKGNKKLNEKCARLAAYYRDADKPEFQDLTAEQLAEVEEFWKPYEFIYKADPYVHRFYTNATGRFDERYIPEDLQKHHMSKYFMEDGYVKAFKDKNYTEIVLRDLPAPKTLVHKITGCFRDADYNPISIDEAVGIISKYQKSVKREKIAVIKPTVGTSRGNGVLPITRRATKNEIKNMLLTWRTDLIVQEVIEQHPKIKKIHPESINSIRIMSFLKDNECLIISACLRVGRDGSFVDNWGKGGLSCGIDEKGICKGPFYDKMGTAFAKHPNGFDPDGFEIPGYEHMVATLKEHHLKFPMLRLISWDFAMGKDEKPIFIEWNMKGDTQLHQLSNGPLYGEHTREILDEFFSHAYKEVKKGSIKYNEFLNHVEVTGCSPDATEVVIEPEINGKPVTVIAAKAFLGNKLITSVTMADSVEKIEYQAFFGCSSMKDVILSNNLSVIGDGAFTNCHGIENVDIESVVTVEQKAFYHCTALKTVTLGNSAQSVGYRAFCDCTGLETFTAGKSFHTIEERAFQGCTNLQEVNTDTGEISVFARAFLKCGKFSKKELEKKCVFKGINCFKGCI